jgi:multidrug efflux pump subunit AcrA (membrane-fusion protein)
MHPQIKLPNPGKCPICFMDLIPLAEQARGGGLRQLRMSAEAVALANVQTERVKREYVSKPVRMVGKVDYDETRLADITSWIPNGRLDRLYVDYTGITVRPGDHLYSVYSPDLIVAQRELLLNAEADRRSATRRDAPPGLNSSQLTEAKLRRWGLRDEQIEQIKRRGAPSDHVTIYAPVGGVVIRKYVNEGAYVKEGAKIYTIADLSQVWVRLDAYEADLPWIRYGQDVTITTDAYPGEPFRGRIALVQPVLNDKTRTVKVRVNVPNLAGKLKPEMFVHATVYAKVAEGGRVMDPSLAGKWICPMHPEVVKDQPGTCDVCGMPLVRAETLGYATAETNQSKPPLVIPSSAALVTGTRAVVYVRLPSMASAAEPALQTLSAVVREGKLAKAREAFATYGKMLDRPYDQPGTDYAKRVWDQYADRLGRDALAGQRARTISEAELALARIEATMDDLRRRFAPPDQPTYEGREIVLGPKAGDYYLVRHGLEEGELVVTQGNFKIDSEIQIQAKPSMMTPEGGGGGAHEHAGHGGGAEEAGGREHTGHEMALPAEFRRQIRDLQVAYEDVAGAVNDADLVRIAAAFDKFGRALAAVDGNQLTGHPRMVWNELAMLLGNDVVEGRDPKQLAEADRVYLLLKGRVRRIRDELGISPEQQPPAEQVAVAPQFQAELAKLWQAYLPIQQALAGDDFPQAGRAVSALEEALAAVNDQPLAGHAQEVWKKERANLAKVLPRLKAAGTIDVLRVEFAPLSAEVGRLAKTFGFGDAGAVYELHCPMALGGRGALWYQNNDEVRNPYYGSAMLKCADRAEQIVPGEPAALNQRGSHEDHPWHQEPLQEPFTPGPYPPTQGERKGP